MERMIAIRLYHLSDLVKTMEILNKKPNSKYRSEDQIARVVEAIE